MREGKEETMMKKTGNTSEERGALALEKVADSLEALVRTIMILIMTERVRM